NGKVIDRRRDFYGHAFVLLAASAIYENSRNARALELANATLEFMDQYLVGPDVQGYAESLPPRPSLRRQNPHMHLFEGLLALWETSGDDTYLSRASSMFDLFATRFFDSTRGVVTEYFDDDLSPASPPEGLIVEPGHLYEWMWLLRRYQYAKGQDCQTYVDALYRSAISLGFDSNRRILSEVLVDGTPHSSQRRVWQVTEAIRANVVEALHGRKMAVDEAGHLVTTLQADFLQPAPFGGWIDRIDCDGKPADSYMPATAFYHLAGAILDVHDLLS
ncbi:MAG: AGE family epimerase/isomerase, partial [Cyanobacteria bacterium]|nr:AGE family epimerase/isomerase [Cyanobacteriota bacterium]